MTTDLLNKGQEQWHRDGSQHSMLRKCPVSRNEMNVIIGNGLNQSKNLGPATYIPSPFFQYLHINSYFWTISREFSSLPKEWISVSWNKFKKKKVRDPPSCVTLGTVFKCYKSQLSTVSKYNEINQIIAKIHSFTNPTLVQ